MIARQRNQTPRMCLIGLKDGVLHRYVSRDIALKNKVVINGKNAENDNDVTALFFPFTERGEGERC